ncbi:hypothetical protein Pst134EA_000737 [Puccinia striiformis f. sp. tritici]|uniref:hypothetical protein n=1 Tax=Puccinia striiformis f. sp. tritici TaxID=168172 RepID=UPI00200764C3|nr:hypothetical protein Pst134EA_000737 [Puccinia striiformis f. sp. tritici]KAH9473658.1 hypothetical protein Pst134EA_000737 [Puccinia striiformis f. sp. tritici]
MSAKLLLLASVLGLIVRGSFAIYCYSGRVVDKEQCHRYASCLCAAISQIVYQDDGTLGTASQYFGYVFGNCSIILLNPNGASPTKKQIHDGYNKILNYCKPLAGTSDLMNDTTITLNIGNRGLASFDESDFPALKEACGLNKNAPAIVKEDCLKAYDSIALSGKGTFLTDGKIATHLIKKTYGTCTIYIYSSDGSILIATSEHIRPTFRKLVQVCNSESGVVSIKGGIEGQNGRLVLSTRNRTPCGAGEPNTQVCH